MNDLRYAIRQLFKQPGFTAVAVLTLAIGIGAVTALYTVMRVAILDPLPAGHGERLVAITEFDTQRQIETGLSATLIHELRERVDIFDTVCGVRVVNERLATDGFSARVRGFGVSRGFFEMLGTPPALGRLPAPAEEGNHSEQVMVISHAWWQQHFDGDPRVIGRIVRFESGNGPYTIIGVMPPEFQFPDRGALGQFWIPLPVESASARPSQPRFYRNWQTLGRLAPGIDLAAAQSALTTHSQRLAQLHPETNKHWLIQAHPLHSLFSTAELRRIYLSLVAAVAGVLLIGGVNVANLMLAQAESRRQEYAIRLALGATRMRLMRQVLVECLLLGLAAGVLGLLAAQWGIDSLPVLLHDSLPQLRAMEMNWGVYSFALALSVATGIFFGLAPALQAGRSTMAEALQSSGKGTPAPARNWLVSSLVIAEISLAMVVLIGAALMFTSVRRILSIDPGFDSLNLIQVGLGQPYRDVQGLGNGDRFFGEAAGIIRSLPQVQAVGWVSPPTSSEYLAEGSQEPVVLNSCHCSIGEMDYFKAIRAPLLAGRAFEDNDLRPTRGAVIVNQRLATLLWPGQNAIGKRFRGATDDLASAWLEVIGVVGDVRSDGFEKEPPPTYYELPLEGPVRFAFVLVRSQAPLDALAPAIRASLAALAPGIPVPTFSSVRDQLRETSRARRTCMQLLGLFAAAGVLLAVIGIYGITACSAARRTREVGIRMALGAQRPGVILLIMRRGLLLVLAGTTLGLFGAHALTRFLGSLLYEVSPNDPGVSLGMSALFALVALTGCYLPARKASKLDPMVALRNE